jgi:hypothetical protein
MGSVSANDLLAVLGALERFIRTRPAFEIKFANFQIGALKANL